MRIKGVEVRVGSLVMVAWKDIQVQTNCSKPIRTLHVETVGWVEVLDREEQDICLKMCRYSDKGHRSFADRQAIPIGCITKIAHLAPRARCKITKTKESSGKSS
jgi:hypothetical protein